jgi:DNA-binding PadR family transcriptional regulator
MKLNQTAYVLLGMLSIEDNQSGYDLRKAVQQSVGYFWGESYGQIYPTLKRMVADGLIVPANTAKGAKLRRQEYSLTEAGRDCLRQWLALPFQNDPPRNEFLLKLFFGREASPAVSIEHIQELNRRNKAMLITLEGIERYAQTNPSPSPHLPYWMLTLSLGLALTRAALDWGAAALVTLEDAMTGSGTPLTTATESPEVKPG